nr:venom protein [Lampona murina]
MNITLSGILMMMSISSVISQDRIIVSNLNLNSSEENNAIPESLLIQMKDIRNVSQLLRQFIAEETFMFGPSVINGSEGRTALSAAAETTIADSANCQLEQHVVELEKPENTASLYWPSCVHVQRCGGCCSSAMVACKPLSTSFINVRVLQLYYNAQNPNALESPEIRTLSVLQHDRCACLCKETAEDCDPNIHDYKPGECRCVCKSPDEAASCTGPEKVWDFRQCACKCMHIQLCSTGNYFNELSCRCEIFTQPLAESLNQPNSNTSLSSQQNSTHSF